MVNIAVEYMCLSMIVKDKSVTIVATVESLGLFLDRRQMIAKLTKRRLHRWLKENDIFQAKNGN